MNDAYVTLVGWVATKPVCRVTSNGISVSSLRVGCTPRYFDREKELWQDMPPTFVTVNCWRQLADNVRASDLKLGEPLIVTGKLRVREYVRGEELRSSTEVEAITLGYDMSRGTCHFERVSRGVATAEDRLEVQEVTDTWANSAGPAPEGYPGSPDESSDSGSATEDPGEEFNLESKAA